MNTTIQSPKLNVGVPSSGDSLRGGAAFQSLRHPRGLFVWVVLLAGLLFHLASPPSARADRNPPTCSGSGLGITLYTSIPDVHIGDTIYYSINVFNGIVGSGRIACDATEIQAFIVTPDGVTHTIPLLRTTLHQGDSDFYNDVVPYTVRAQDVRPDGSLVATARDTGTIHQNDSNSTGGGFQEVNTEVNLPCVLLTALCVSSTGENGAITFTGMVTNCGNNTLVGVTVTNFHDAGNFTVLFPTNLARGQAAAFSGSWVPLNPCLPSTAILTVRATDQFTSTPQTVTNFTTVTCQNTTTPGILVTKACPVAPVSPGQLLNFSGTVSNTGNVTLNNIVVVNDQPAANTAVFTLASLAPGAVASFNGSYLAPTNCSVSDTLTATATSRCGVAVSSIASATCPILTTPQIVVIAACPPTPLLPGGTLIYSGTVRNAGNITLTDVVVVSDRPAANTTVFTVASLAPGASASFTSSVSVPASACSLTTTFRGTGRDLCTLSAVTNTAAATCTAATAPAIAVTLACPVVSASTGGPITYTGTVSNPGNVTLNNVTVVNNRTVPGTVLTVPSLAPGASANFSASFTAPTDACSVSSTVTATGSDNCTAAMVTNSASATCPLITTPSIVVTQVCPVNPALPGTLLTYSGTVRNAGNITLTNVVVLNNLSGATPVYTAVSLAPGAVAGFTGSYLASTNCSNTSTVTATGRSICGIEVTSAASATCPIVTAPALVVTLACPPGSVTPGSLITYSGTVRNSGNVTLNNLSLSTNSQFTTSGPITAGLVGYWALDEASGNTALDGSVSANNGTIVNATRVAGRFGSALSFNGLGDAVYLNNPTGLQLTNFTINAWIKRGSLTQASQNAGGAVIFGYAPDGFGLLLTDNGSLVLTRFDVSDGVSSGALRVLDNNFHQVTVTRSGTTVVFYVDGVASAPQTYSDAGFTFNVRAAIGSRGDSFQNSFLGVIDEVRVYDLALSSAEINTFSTSAGGSTGLFVLSSLAPGASASFITTATVPAGACSITANVMATGSDSCIGTAVSNTASATCPVMTTPAIVVTLACPPVAVVPGSLITYSGTVRNSGDIVLNNVTVINNQTVPSTVLTVPSLAPGASANFTASFTAPAGACSVSSTVTATGSDNCTAALVTNSVSATCPLVTMPSLAVTKACPAQPVALGGVLVFTGTVTNTGNITLTNVIVINSQPAPNTQVLGPMTLAPGAGTTFTGSYTTPLDVCAVTDVLLASGNDQCTGQTVTHTISATCPLLTAPAIVVTQACPPTPVGQGSLLTYSGTVRNAGNITLTNVVVVNNWPAPNMVIFTAASLAPGATRTFTGSYVVPLNCCVAWSTVQARGQDSCTGATVSDTDSGTCTVLTGPQIVVTKVCPPTALRPGALLEYSGTVSNTGNITLIDVTLVSTQPTAGTPILGPVILAPGESMSYTASYVVPPDFCGTDTVSARGLDACTFAPVVGSVTTTCPIITTPRIAITKHCPPLPTPHGSLLVFSGTVSNPGNVTLTNVFVVNNQPTNNTPVLGPITLAPGAFFDFTGSYTAPALCCEMTDTLAARGQDRCSGVQVAASATAICPLLYTPGIALVQTCPPAPLPMGSVYVFSGFVTNTGDAILTNVVVFSSQPGQTLPWLGPVDLAPGESEIYAGLVTVPSNTCAVTVTATSQETCKGTWVTNTTACPVATTPLLALTQTCPVTPVIPGGLLTYSGTVSNPGNITLNNIVVTNSQSGNTPILSVATLAPGASANFSGTYLAPTTGPVATSTSTARATSLCSEPVTNSVTSICPIVSTPRIAVAKLCPPAPIAPGGILVFSGTVANVGNVTLTNVFVVNNQPAPNTPVLGPITLAPGADTNFTGSYVVPLNVCSSSDTLTVTARDASTGLALTNAASANCAFLTTPIIAITQSCPPGPVVAGSSVAFNGLVSNTGNITLTNVLVFGSQPTNNTPVMGPLTLAPGASMPFAGSYLATGGSNPTTNTTIVTNSSVVITTNTVTPSFGTIDPVTGILTYRFNVVSNLHGLMFADQDQNWGATLFYTTRHPETGPDQFVTISAAGVITDRFSLSSTNYDALTLAAPDVGYGSVNFYYLRHGSPGINTFGVIKAAGASSSSDLPVSPIAGTNYNSLAFAAANVGGYGENLFYSLRETNGVTVFGTIAPSPGLVPLDRYTVGTNANFDSMVFVPGTVSTWGTAIFAYLRHDNTGSIIGTIDPVTHVATDRLSLGTNLLSALTFTATDVGGFGPNLFYYLLPERTILTTNTVITFVTNSVVSFTPTNTVTATGMDLCQARTVAAAADCVGSVTPAVQSAPPAQPAAPLIKTPKMVNRIFSLSFPTESGIWYTVQYKNALEDPAWIDLEIVVGTGGDLPITAPAGAANPTRFYRIISMPTP